MFQLTEKDKEESTLHTMLSEEEEATSSRKYKKLYYYSF